MTSLKEIIKDITYQIYTIDDFANKWEIDAVISTFENQQEYLSNYDFNGDYTLTTIKDYLIVKKIDNYSNYLDRMIAEYKEKMQPICDYYHSIFSRFTEKGIVRFYNDGFDFNPGDDADLVLTIYKDLPSHTSGLDEDTFVRAINAEPHLILHDMKSYAGAFKKYNNLYETLFSDSQLEVYSIDSEYFINEVVEFFKLTDQSYRPIQAKITKMYIDAADEILANNDPEKALEYQIKYKSLIRFLRETRHPDYNRYQKKQKDVDKLCNKWLQENGQKYSYEIPVDAIKAQIENDKVAPMMKQIMLTHLRDGNKLVHFSELAMRQEDALMDLFSHSNDTNENFTMSVQQALAIYHQMYLVMLGLYLHNEKHYKDYIDNLTGFIEAIYEYLNINHVALKGQIDAWKYTLGQYCALDSIDNDNALYIEDILTEKTVKLIERILHDVVVEEYERHSLFCNAEKLTLGQIIACKAGNPLCGILSEKFLHYIAYCLTKDVDSKGAVVGLNIRNDLAHGVDISDESKHVNTQLCLMLFTGVINSLFLYYNDKATKEKREEQERYRQQDEAIKRQNKKLDEVNKHQMEYNRLLDVVHDEYKHILEDIQNSDEYKKYVANASEHIKSGTCMADFTKLILEQIDKKKNESDTMSTYAEHVDECNHEHLEMYKSMLEYYDIIMEDKKKLFSKEYLVAIEELADAGLFFYDLTVPDIPEKIIYSSDRRDILTDYYVLEIRKIYKNMLDGEGKVPTAIRNIVVDIEDEEYHNAIVKIYKMLIEDMKDFNSNYNEYISKENTKDNYQYYHNASKKILSYWDKIYREENAGKDYINYYDLAYENPVHKVNKFDCVSLLTLDYNVKRLIYLYAALNAINK